jgi:hypothetical protein
MSEDKKEVTQKIVDTFTDINDLRECSNSQYKVIVSQSKKISELEKKLESTEAKLIKAEQTNTVSSVLNKDQTGGSNDDGSTICLIQLALLRAAAMNGELTLEECKKVEIYVKTLQVIKGKTEGKEKPKDTGRALTNEELIALMSAELTEQ